MNTNPDSLSILADEIEQLERAADVAREKGDSYLATTIEAVVNRLHRAFRLLSVEAGIVPLITAD